MNEIESFKLENNYLWLGEPARLSWQLSTKVANWSLFANQSLVLTKNAASGNFYEGPSSTTNYRLVAYDANGVFLDQKTAQVYASALGTGSYSLAAGLTGCLAATQDGTKIYVGQGQTLKVLNASGQQQTSISFTSLNAEPLAMVLNKAETQGYLVLKGSTYQLATVNLNTNVFSIIETFANSQASSSFNGLELRLSVDETKIAILVGSNGSLSVPLFLFNLSSNSLSQDVTTSRFSSDLVFLQDGGFYWSYIGNANERWLSRVNSDGSIPEKNNISSLPAAIQAMALDTERECLYLAVGSADVSLKIYQWSLNSQTLTNAFLNLNQAVFAPVGNANYSFALKPSLLINENASYLYVNNGSQLSVIHLPTFTLKTTLGINPSFASLVQAPDEPESLYLVSMGNNSLARFTRTRLPLNHSLSVDVSTTLCEYQVLSVPNPLLVSHTGNVQVLMSPKAGLANLYLEQIVLSLPLGDAFDNLIKPTTTDSLSTAVLKSDGNLETTNWSSAISLNTPGQAQARFTYLGSDKKLTESYVLQLSFMVNGAIGPAEITVEERSGLASNGLSSKFSSYEVLKEATVFWLKDFRASAAQVPMGGSVFLSWQMQVPAGTSLSLQCACVGLDDKLLDLASLSLGDNLYRYPADGLGIALSEDATFSLMVTDNTLKEVAEFYQYRVSVLPVPRIESFSVDKLRVYNGQSVVLSWRLNEAMAYANLYRGPELRVGNLPLVGSYSDTPQTSVDYTLKAYDKNGVLADSRCLSTYDVYRVFKIGEYISASSIAIAPDGKYAYVGNQNPNSVRVINIENKNNPINMGSVLVDGPPSSIAIEPDGKYAYVGNQNSNSVSVINIENKNNPINMGQVEVGYNPISIVIEPDGHYAYVASNHFERADSNNVSVIDIRNREKPKNVGNVKLDGRPLSIAIEPDGKYAYIGNQNFSVSVIDISDREKPKNVLNLEVGARPNSIAIEPDGKYAYVANMSGTNVLAFDISEREKPKNVGQVDVGSRSPTSIAIAPDGHYAYVANSYPTSSPDFNNVSVIDIRDRENPKNVDKVKVGGYPSSIVITPDGQYAYYAGGGFNVSVIPLLATPKPNYAASSSALLASSSRTLIEEDAPASGAVSAATSARFPSEYKSEELSSRLSRQQAAFAKRGSNESLSPGPGPVAAFNPLATLRQTRLRETAQETLSPTTANKLKPSRFG